MAQKALELILIRQLATRLALPMFVIDTTSRLLFYNAAAERILGRRFAETGELAAEEWTSGLDPTDEQGAPLPPAKQPLLIASRERRPAHGRLWVRGLDNVRRLVDATCFPLVGMGDHHLGVVAITWPVEEPA
jgi:PAS domain-containing protein